MVKINKNDLQEIKKWLKISHGININTGNKLGEGTFGKVYLGKFNNKEVAIKVIYIETKDELNDLNTEVNISEHLNATADYMLSPIVYFADYKIINNKCIGIIVMEKMDMDCSSALEMDGISDKTKVLIVEKMLDIINYMIESRGIVCSDVKPANFLYNKNNNDVKIIDLDGYSCFNDNQLNEFDFNAYFNILLLQMYIMIYRIIKNNKKLLNQINEVFVSIQSFSDFIINIEDYKYLNELYKLFKSSDKSKIFIKNLFWYADLESDNITKNRFINNFDIIIKQFVYNNGSLR